MLSRAIPAYYISHGGGPMPLMAGQGGQSSIVKQFMSVRKEIEPRLNDITSIIVVTAHWNADVTTVSTAKNPGMLYDYYGFPPETYKYKYEAPGNPKLAKQIRSLLDEHGIENNEDNGRGFDHGTFVPLMLMFPEANIPVVQVSLTSDMNPITQLNVGKALSSLRSEGVLIIGSGFSFHNLNAMFNWDDKRKIQVSSQFDQWLNQTIVESKSNEQREKSLIDWAKEAPNARICHPREEHLLPVHVCAGTLSDNEAAQNIFSDTMMGVKVSGFRFGNL